jgi:hypothetical protein
MSIETDMIFRLREERNQAQARALEYAKWGETLHEALLYILDLDEVSPTNAYQLAIDHREIAERALNKSEKEFNYKLFYKDKKE